MNNSYKNIANDYDLKRKKPWKILETFLDGAIEKCEFDNSIILDLGSGNARNIPLFKTKYNKVVGIEKTLEFIKISKKNLENNFWDQRSKNLIQFINCDFLNIPIRRNLIKIALSIASLHHIKEKASRQNFISQVYEILKINGFFLITVWRRYQKKYRWYFIKDFIKRIFYNKYSQKQVDFGLPKFGDIYIPWTVMKENKTYYRFYHFFSKYEILRAVSKFKIKCVKNLGGPNKEDNIFILAQKVL